MSISVASRSPHISLLPYHAVVERHPCRSPLLRAMRKFASARGKKERRLIFDRSAPLVSRSERAPRRRWEHGSSRHRGRRQTVTAQGHKQTTKKLLPKCVHPFPVLPASLLPGEHPRWRADALSTALF